MRRLNEILSATNGERRESNVEPQVDDPPPDAEEDVCPLCKGARFLRLDLPLSHPEFGRAQPCRCVEEESQEARRDRLQRYSNLGPLARLTFENLIRRGRMADPQEQKRFQRCVGDLEAFAQDPQNWHVLVGPSGCGKTHIAAAVANGCLERGTPALFVVVPDLLDHLRAAYKPDADVSYDQLFEQVRNAPVLILDDLGTQSATPWAQEKLFQIINHRFNARLPTVVTTNVPLNKFDERLRMRLGDPSLPQPHADLLVTVHALERRRAPELRGLNMLEFPKIREMTFETFDLLEFRSDRDREWREGAYNHALSFAAEPENWLAFYGGRSRDRTHLISAIANYRSRLGEAPVLVQVAELLDFLRQALHGDSGEDYYRCREMIRDCPLLLLDDLEIGMGSEWVRGELNQMLKRRSLARLPTVISTPSQPNDLVRDSGWMQLTQLLRDPQFCSEVIAGETPPEEIVETPRPQKSKPARRQKQR